VPPSYRHRLRGLRTSRGAGCARHAAQTQNPGSHYANHGNASQDVQVWVYNPLARLTGARRSRSTGRSWWLTSGRGARALQAAERSGAPPAAPGPLLLQGLLWQACPPQRRRAGACDSILCDTALALQICLRAPLREYPPQDGPLRHS